MERSQNQNLDFMSRRERLRIQGVQMVIASFALQREVDLDPPLQEDQSSKRSL